MIWAVFTSYPPVVVRQEPPVYIEQSVPASSPAPEVQAYWYYCSPAGGYYPTVKECSEPWIKVPPRK